MYLIILNVVTNNPQLQHTHFSVLATHIYLSVMYVEDELRDKNALLHSLTTCLVQRGFHMLSDYDLYFCPSLEWKRLRYSCLTEQNSCDIHYNFLNIEYIIHYYLANQLHVYWRDNEDERMAEEMHCFHK